MRLGFSSSITPSGPRPETARRNPRGRGARPLARRELGDPAQRSFGSIRLSAASTCSTGRASSPPRSPPTAAGRTHPRGARPGVRHHRPARRREELFQSTTPPWWLGAVRGSGARANGCPDLRRVRRRPLRSSREGEALASTSGVASGTDRVRGHLERRGGCAERVYGGASARGRRRHGVALHENPVGTRSPCRPTCS